MVENSDKILKDLIKSLFYMTKVIEKSNRFNTAKINVWNERRGSRRRYIIDQELRRQEEANKERRKYEFLLRNLIGRLKKEHNIK